MNRKIFIHLILWGGLIVLTFYLTQYGITKAHSILQGSFNREDLAVYCIFSLCFSLLYISNMRFLRLLALSYTFLAYSIFLCYLKINNLSNFETSLGFEISDANLLWSDAFRPGAILDVMMVYWKAIIYGTVESLACVSIIYFLSRMIKFRIQRTIVSVGPVVVISIAYFLLGSGAEIDKMPVVEKVPMQLSFASKLDVYRGEREPAKLSLIQDKIQFPLIIYVVDESIRGDLLGINGFKLNTTPFLAGYKGTLLNYGVAVSAGNCSAPSHIFLQTGVIPKSDSLARIDHELFSKPNIFQYAQHAGYRTVFVEGQLKGDKLQNYMSSQDFKYIDEYIQIRSVYDNTERYAIDMHIADEVARRANSNVPTFFYVLKSGAHFPAGLTYPASEEHFAPIAMSASAATLAAYRNGYYNSIRWNVDQYFKKMLGLIDRTDSLIIYTSDHSENLMDYGDKFGHCSSAVYPSEVKVPIFIIATGESQKLIRAMAEPTLMNNQNEMTHFNIFPTLLITMGYKSIDVKEQYGPSLFDRHKENEVRFSITNLVPGRESTKIVKFIEKAN